MDRQRLRRVAISRTNTTVLVRERVMTAGRDQSLNEERPTA